MNRIISCFTNCYGPSGVRTAAEKIRDAGIEHLELALRGHNFGGLVIPEEVVVTEKADDATASEFRDHLKRLGVKVSGCNVGGGDMRTDEGTALTERRIRFARKWFDVDIVVSGASQPTTPEERRAVVENLRKVGDVAQELGMVIALETHKGPTQNADEMLTLMFEVHHPAVRLNYDTGNILYYNPGADVHEQLDRVKDYVRNVHLKDSRGRPEDWYFPAVGDGGAIDFRRIREQLDAIGYAGPYTIEIEGIGGEDEPGLDERHNRIKRSVDHLKACGYFD
ncbi:sugar phosphate isomerase/epimerase family protein [Tautonia sp. JC769]|uniref:sugar phosphate isomerase/epimerase family protein n=1 Tax=Tautonia sp. JC769 TaxID=3232135 RepID=UPI00345A7561